MAESVSDQNVEDMLSSVRRLVSSELPRNQRPELKESASALVLTQAQRVEPKPPMQASKGLSLEERIAELEAAVGGQPNEWEPDGSEDEDVHRPDRIVYRPSRPRTEEEARRPLRLSEIALIETGPANGDEDPVDEAEEDAREAVAFQHEDQETEEQQTEAEAMPQEQASPDPVPPSELAGDPFADTVARDVAAVVAEMAEASLITEKDFEAALAEAVRDPAETRGLPRENASSSDTEAEAAPALASPEDDIADHQTADEAGFAPQAGFEAEPEPDLEVEPSTEPQVEVEAEFEPNATASPSEPEENRAGTGAASLDSPVETEQVQAMSTEDLHQTISTIIRQELQGELGERITRNVRKLVRQEVHRALAVRDLE